MGATFIAITLASFGLGGIGVIQPIENFFGLKPPPPLKSTVSIYVGQTGQVDLEHGQNSGGIRPGVALFDSGGLLVGSTDPDPKTTIKDGSMAQITITNESNSQGRKSEHISVWSGTGHPICVASVGVTGPDGTKSAWFADVAQACGAQWYYNNRTFDDAGTYTPKCIWLGNGLQDGVTTRMVSVHLPSFQSSTSGQRSDQWKANPKLMCNSLPRMAMWNKQYNHLIDDNGFRGLHFLPNIAFNQDETDADENLVMSQTYGFHAMDTATFKSKHLNDQDATDDDFRRTNGVCDPFTDGKECPCFPSQHNNKSVCNTDVHLLVKRDPPLLDSKMLNSTGYHGGPAKPLPSKLIVSHHDSHSANEICGSKSSWGPDFVSVSENIFCDMTTKQAWDLCSDTKTQDCFDMSNYSIRPSKFNAVVARTMNGTSPYSMVTHWKPEA